MRVGAKRVTRASFLGQAKCRGRDRRAKPGISPAVAAKPTDRVSDEWTAVRPWRYKRQGKGNRFFSNPSKRGGGRIPETRGRFDERHNGDVAAVQHLHSNGFT